MTKFRSLCWLSFFNTSEAVAQSTGLSRWMTESVWSEGLCAEGILQAKTWREKASASGEPRLWHLSGFPQFSIINYLFLGTPTYTTFFWQSSRGSDLLAENGKSFQHETSPSLVTLVYQVTIQEWEWVPEEVLWVGWVGLEGTGWSIRGFPRDWTKVLPQFLPWFTHPILNILRPGRVEEKHFPKWPTWWATAFNIFQPSRWPQGWKRFQEGLPAFAVRDPSAMGLSSKPECQLANQQKYVKVVICFLTLDYFSSCAVVQVWGAPKFSSFWSFSPQKSHVSFFPIPHTFQGHRFVGLPASLYFPWFNHNPRAV